MQPIPRSMLFTPATLTAHFDAAVRSGADALILDLEDAVAPRDKPQARHHALEFLARTDASPSVATALRINAPSTRSGWQDLGALLDSDADPDFVVIPKAQSADVAGLVKTLLRQSGKTCRIMVIAETALAAAHPGALCDASVVDAVLFGAADMSADLCADPGAAIIGHARNALLTHAAAAGIPAIDTPFFDLHDAAGLREASRTAAVEGFAGKAAIHPRQIGAINTAFTPDKHQVAWANDVLDANDAGTGTVAGAMVDEAIARRARRILTRTHA